MSSNESHHKATTEPAKSAPGAGGDTAFLVFLTFIFSAAAGVVLGAALNIGSVPVVAVTSAETASAPQPAPAERYVPFHERYGVQPGQPEGESPTF